MKQTPSRIMIFGRPGSGKSTFALKLSKQIDIDLHHLDRYFFMANWVERNYQEFLDIQEDIVSSPCWIVDGNNTKSLELRYSRADLVIYFNHPRWICYQRVFKRLFDKNPEIKDRAEGCSETMRFALLRYMWGFEQRVSDQITESQKKYPRTELIEVRSDRDVRNIENEIQKRLKYPLC